MLLSKIKKKMKLKIINTKTKLKDKKLITKLKLSAFYLFFNYYLVWSSLSITVTLKSTSLNILSISKVAYARAINGTASAII